MTAEDERLDADPAAGRRYGAAVIALPNDEEEIPAEPERRLALARKIIDTATGMYGIPLEDIVIDPLAMPVGADTSLVAARWRRSALIRDEFGREHDARRVERVVRHAGPGRDRLRVPAHGHQGRPDQRDHGRPVRRSWSARSRPRTCC